MNEIIITVVGVISTGIMSYLTFLFARSKYKQEVEKLKVEVLQARVAADSLAIDNDIKLANNYKSILDDLKLRYDSQFKEYELAMARKVKLLEEENKLKDRKIKLQRDEIITLNREIKILRDNANNSSK